MSRSREPASVPLALVVEDEDDLRAALVMVVEEAGYRAMEARDGRVALQRIAGERPDVVLLDLRMPRFSGHDFLAVRAHDPTLREIPVVVLSAELQVALSDVKAFLRKPVEMDLLLRVLADACRPDEAAVLDAG